MGITAAIVGALAGAAVASSAARSAARSAVRDVEPPPRPIDLDEEVAKTEVRKRRRLRGAGGRSSTILTGPLGVEQGQTFQGNTLLGR